MNDQRLTSSTSVLSLMASAMGSITLAFTFSYFVGNSWWVAVLGAGSFAFAFSEARTWKLIDTIFDIAKSSVVEARHLRKLSSRLNSARNDLWQKWNAGFFGVIITGFCSFFLNSEHLFGIRIVFFSIGFSTLGMMVLTAYRINCDFRGVQNLRYRQIQDEKSAKERQDEIARMAVGARIDPEADTHLASFGKVRPQ